MNIGRSIINISVPKDLGKQISAMAKKENKSKSQLLRDAFNVYQFQQDWIRIRIWGERIAERMGIETYDDVERIAG